MAPVRREKECPAIVRFECREMPLAEEQVLPGRGKLMLRDGEQLLLVVGQHLVAISQRPERAVAGIWDLHTKRPNGVDEAYPPTVVCRARRSLATPWLGLPLRPTRSALAHHTPGDHGVLGRQVLELPGDNDGVVGEGLLVFLFSATCKRKDLVAARCAFRSRYCPSR